MKPLPALLCAGLTVLLFGACKKEKIDVTDPVPVILNVTTSNTNVTAFEDQIVFALEYRDGDGDLGENVANVENLFVVDNRINITETYRISALAPNGASIPIQGTLNVYLPSTGITDGSSSQVVTYTIYIRDRAGNESNHFVTPPITVTP